MNRRRAISIFLGSRTCDRLPNMQRKMTVVDIQRFQRSKKARERWRRNLKTLRLLCGNGLLL
jgi:hypothetical protein